MPEWDDNWGELPEDEHAKLQNHIEYLMTLPSWDASTIAAGLIEVGYKRSVK